jgi:hypothetical protein
MKKIFDRIVFFFSGIALVLYGFAFVDFLLHPLAKDAIFQSNLFRPIVTLLIVPLTLLVGFLIIRRVPGNVVGPLLIVWSASMSFVSIRQGINPWVLALYTYFDIYGWLALFLMILHFPDGRIYPRAASPWIYLFAGFMSFPFIFMFLSWATFPESNQVANPFFLPVLGNQSDLIAILTALIYSPLLITGIVLPLLRYRKGNKLERQQLKLLALFAGVFTVYALLGFFAYPLLVGRPIEVNPGNNLFGMIFYITAGLLPALSIGVAVLRYRLWDIDLVIRRTLVYSILTVSLTLVYFGSVVVLQSLFNTVIGRQSPAAIVLTTLMIAALFTPFRRLIQTVIDRRFYRKKYDTERVLASFSATLSEKVDLDQLTNSILVVVEETMQPAQLSMWLRDGQRPRIFPPFDGNTS